MPAGAQCCPWLTGQYVCLRAAGPGQWIKRRELTMTRQRLRRVTIMVVLILGLGFLLPTVPTGTPAPITVRAASTINGDVYVGSDNGALAVFNAAGCGSSP